MPDDPMRSDFTAAGHGVYSLTMDELRLILDRIREWNELRGGYPSAPQLQAELRRPGL